MLKAIPHYLCSLPHLSPLEQLPPQRCFPAQLAEAPPKKFFLTKPLWSDWHEWFYQLGLPKLDRQDNRKLPENIRWITISCKPVAVPASTNWDLASVESPESLKIRKQKILHEFCKYKPLLYAVRIFQPFAAAPVYYIVRERTHKATKNE